MNVSPQDRVFAVLQRLLTERSIGGSPGPNTNLLKFGLNSLDMLNLVLTIEVEFNITIPDSDITPVNLLSISAISSLVVRLLNNS
jgi:acyl carrier protein